MCSGWKVKEYIFPEVLVNNLQLLRKGMYMKAITFSQYGTAEVLEEKELDKPSPKANEVLVKVHAIALNDWDWQALRGIPFVNRMIFGLFRPKKQVLGSDIAGVVESAGSNVTKFKAGDEVYGDLTNYWGGFAEYARAHEKMLTLKPPSMTFAQAASLPQAGALAYQALIDLGRVASGQKILVNGAGGGVGTFGVQIAKQFDVEMTGVDNTGKLELMQKLGYDHVIDYTKENFTKNGQQYDMIVDNKMNRSVLAYLRSLRKNGIYVTCGGESGPLLKSLPLVPFTGLLFKKRIGMVMLQPNRGMSYMNELFESGKMKPVIDETSFTLAEVPDAMKYFGEGKHRGKVVVRVVPESG